MSLTTSLEQLAEVGQLPNIRKHRNGWQVRVHPFPAESYASIADAITRREELIEYRNAGLRYLPATDRVDDLPLLAWGDKLVEAKRTRGGKRGPLSERGLKFWTDSVRPWAGELREDGERKFSSRDGLPERQRWSAARDDQGRLLAEFPLSTLSLLDVEPYIDGRAEEARNVAAYEAQGLKAILRFARRHGARFDDRLLELEPIAIPKSTRGLALTPEQLDFLVERAPEHARGALSLMGTAGFRLSELLSAERGHFDVKTRTLYVPKPKEQREKIVPLTTSEAKLVARQLIEFPSSSRRIFARIGGTPWRREGFYDDVLTPARASAIADHREENRLDEDAPTPFDRIDNHRLRHTAITNMLRDGLKIELVAQRVGHADGGALLLRTYRHVASDELREALDAREAVAT